MVQPFWFQSANNREPSAMARLSIEPVGNDTIPLVTVSPLDDRMLPRTSSLYDALGEAVPIPTEPGSPNDASFPLINQVFTPAISTYCGLINQFFAPSEVP